MRDTLLPTQTDAASAHREEPRPAGSSIGLPTMISTGRTEEAQSLGGTVFHPHQLRLLGRNSEFFMRLRSLETPSLTLGLLSYNSPVHILSQEFSNAYQVNLPISGRLRMTRGRQSLFASPTIAAVHGPGVPTTLEGWVEQTTLLGLKIQQHVLEEELHALLGRAPKETLAFEGSLNLNRQGGHEWFTSLQLLAGCLKEGQSLSSHPMIFNPIAQAIARGLLLIAPNNYSEQLHAATPAAEPVYLRRAISYMEENATLPLSLSAVAQAVEISNRSLQAGFQKHLNTTPMAYLKSIRMRRAHEDLMAAAPGETVASIAARWGFTHAGRFAIHYAQIYGFSPSQNLRND